MSQQKTQESLKTQKTSSSQKIFIFSLVSILTAVLLSVLICKYLFTPNKIAYVDSSKLMIGFSEANKVNKEIEAEKKQYEENLKVLEDSVKANMDLMSKEFDSATPKKKNELREKLREWNTKMNRYQKAGAEEVANKHQQKMEVIIKKMNAYITEYGREHKYDLILGTTTGGNILYANQDKIDITDKIVKGLNERYK